MRAYVYICVAALQSPASCFNLTYNVALFDERANIETAVSLPGSTDSDTVTLLIPGLRENTNYSATVSAHNHFQFSIDSPVQADRSSFGESSHAASGRGVVGVVGVVMSPHYSSTQSHLGSSPWWCCSMGMRL